MRDSPIADSAPAAALVLLCLALMPIASLASMPAAFNAEYEASYGGIRARAERSLQYQDNNPADSNALVEMQTSLEFKLLGQTLSSINESSLFALNSRNEPGIAVTPQYYIYEQRGLGRRKRELSFDWDSGTVLARMGRKQLELTLDGPTADNLSGLLEIRRQLMAGETEISFTVVDKGEIEEAHYRVMGYQQTDTELGPLETVMLEKVRSPDNARSTQLWMATDWDYLLVKLLQEEPGERSIELQIKHAVVDDTEVTGKSSAPL